MWNEYFEMEFDDDRPAPLVCAPEVKIIRGALWSWAELRCYRLYYYHPESWREIYVKVPGVGWAVTEDIPEDVERALCAALCIEYIP